MQKNQALAEKQEISWFWEEVDAEIRGALTPQQRVAIEEAVQKSAANAETADFRLHLGKFFVRIIAGKERRSPERLKRDLENNPVFAKKNRGVIAVFWALMFCTTLYVLAFMTNFVIQFFFT